MKPIRVMIVEDSAVVRELLTSIIASDSRLELVSSVERGEEALAYLERVQPDVISMDIRLPGIDGFETTRQIMRTRPTPIVVVSASVEAEDLKISFNALQAGALAVLEKPVGVSHADYTAMAERLCTQLLIMSQVKVVRQRRGNGTSRLSQPVILPPPLSNATLKILGIVSSTGGPQALTTILPALGANFPLPILLVQHITPSFLEGFVDWLNSVCPQRVCLAKHGQYPEPNTVYMAPATHHLTFRRGRIQLEDGPPVSIQKPSGTVLLQSLAEMGAAAMGVVLTGMGDDGADGLLAMRQAGGYTIAESETTAVVYGMPRAAVERGAVNQILPLDEIATHIRKGL